MSVRKKYRNNPESFLFEYRRENATRKISMDIEDNIMKELVIEKQPIAYPLHNCNYIILGESWDKLFLILHILLCLIHKGFQTGFSCFLLQSIKGKIQPGYLYSSLILFEIALTIFPGIQVKGNTFIIPSAPFLIQSSVFTNFNNKSKLATKSLPYLLRF